MRVHLFIDVPAELAGVTRDFWSRVTGWSLGQPWPVHTEFTSLEPSEGETYTHVQVIDGPPRVHLDLMVDDRGKEVERLRALGATVGAANEWWQVMESPGGLPFCLIESSESPPLPVAASWPGGHRSQLQQVCIDVPRPWLEHERDFWTQLTGWPLSPSDRDEFEGTMYPPPGGPVRVLLQRLDTSDPGARTRAHLDLGTDDVDAEVERVASLGARRVGPGDGWFVLEDPAGLAFCVTARAPD